MESGFDRVGHGKRWRKLRLSALRWSRLRWTQTRWIEFPQMPSCWGGSCTGILISDGTVSRHLQELQSHLQEVQEMQKEAAVAADEASRRVLSLQDLMISAFRTRAEFLADHAYKASVAQAAAATSTPGVGAKAAAKTTTPGATTPVEKTTTPDTTKPWLDAKGRKKFSGWKAPPPKALWLKQLLSKQLAEQEWKEATPAKAPPAPQLAEQERRPAVAGEEAEAQADAKGVPAEASPSS